MTPVPYQQPELHVSRPETWLEFARSEPLDHADGVEIRTLRSEAESRRVFQIIPVDERSDRASFTEVSTPTTVTLETPHGVVDALFDERGDIRISGQTAGFRLLRDESAAAGYRAEWAVEGSDGRLHVNLNGSRLQLVITVLAGSHQITAGWDGVGSRVIDITFLPVDGQAEILVQSFVETPPAPPSAVIPFADAQRRADAAFADWCAGRRAAGDARATRAWDDALRAQYSCLVPPSRFLPRPSMLISHDFNGVWSWDHSFTAIALSVSHPELAWDQLMIPFDHQTREGALPDYVKSGEIVWNFTKPPVHGWALRSMLQRSDAISDDQLTEFYPKLTAWTNWWFEYRDDNGDGFPEYDHGNESGWDNSTVFGEPGGVESPDLLAYLIVQMDILAAVASRLGLPREAAEWRSRSDGLLSAMLREFWDGEMFIARDARTARPIRTRSLLHWIPVILGRRLPSDVLERAVRAVGTTGPFLGEWGLATEQFDSPDFRARGYWRGPIWAAPTYMIVSALSEVGEGDLARDIATRFVRMVDENGIHENYDAVSSSGNDAPMLTWTAGVFQILSEMLG
ncbi:trehalase family glycosidase [Curtobacterium sp. MCBD17_040]|uniref:amylo-alpha-1,6-glucosidase n=1 Tax=Curtobacterium sp. MCBD17_040 TaxID=2175674 RepID=UPI0024DFC65D|nr:trehalase family glycosidase [Curtobacterium sp. MCBD17_040]WIB65965.1 trehalase family glycosidase [Curtobacterium sp. MCBD17_040]